MKLNLLLADDDITTVNHLQEIIERELAGQFSIFTASDGLMALKRLKETKMHIIISDIRMPDMRGDEFLHAVKSDERFRHIRMVMLSSEDSTSERIQLLQDGAEDYIVKPFNPMELKVRIEKFLK